MKVILHNVNPLPYSARRWLKSEIRISKTETSPNVKWQKSKCQNTLKILLN